MLLSRKKDISLIVDGNEFISPVHGSRMRTSHNQVTHLPKIRRPEFNGPKRSGSPVNASGELYVSR